jgi:predicted nucleic acid-binding protein
VNVVDSSGWIEYFAGGSNAEKFAPVIEEPESLVVPSLSLYEVFKNITRIAGDSAAVDATAVMLASRVVDLNAAIAFDAARITAIEGLAMADSIILATARAEQAVLWTQDSHFEGIRGVEFVPK